jgi:4-nitrophenyl phosphatase
MDSPDCLFIATNEDATFPASDAVYPGELQVHKARDTQLNVNAGTGSIVAAISNAVGRRPLVLGKPHKTMMDCILQE